jgi:hypothetical protein
MGGAHASGVGRACLRGRVRTPVMRGSAHVCEGRARTPARWGARTPARRGRARLRGARTHVARARTPARWEARTSVGWFLIFFHFFHFFSFFGSFAPHFQIKLGIHASNFNSTFVVMSELELSFLMGVLAPYFNTMDLVKTLENSPKFHIQIVAVTLKVRSCKTINKKKK